MTEEEAVAAKVCPVCRESMDTDHAWWWTLYGAACSETCAREHVLRNLPHSRHA